ncbi:MAG: TonB-dependent receptor [Flavobacteriales bacterium]|nr:TonB-dependent receptor [Flavobacteriales bacterium]
MKYLILLTLTLLISASTIAQNKYTISGHVLDNSSGEKLLGASIYIDTLLQGTTANLYGFYSLTVPEGKYMVRFSYIGFQTLYKEIDLTKNVRMDIDLDVASSALEVVTITAKARDGNIKGIEMSTTDLTIETIKRIPALFGEVDVIKSIQLLPGVQTVGEGNSGFYVRGGGVDQNLILLDEAPVYNASHLMGFFSVFNPDAIKDVQLYKGGIPAQYGGKLSSVLDIRMKDGNKKKFHGSGGIGNISSRLTLEGPIVKNKGSFIVSGRRSYADIFLKLAPDTNLRKSQLYFYDLNIKANYDLDSNNRLFLSGYFGEDNFNFAGAFGLKWGNATGTLRWNHVYGQKLFSNVSVVYSKFNYKLGIQDPVISFDWISNIEDVSVKVDYNYYLNPNNSIKFGFQISDHHFNLGRIESDPSSTIQFGFNPGKVRAIEPALYVSNEQRFGTRFSAIYGLRYSMFSNIGVHDTLEIYSYGSDYAVSDTSYYKKGEVYNTYAGWAGLEPRLGLKYELTDESSVKASYNRTRQYVHLASNSTASSPLDIWFPSSKNVKPQLADQVAVGYFRNIRNDMFETSAEVYYKKMQNSIDFKDHAYIFLNKLLEGEMRFGESYSYGLELLVRKQVGKFQGWISYTLSRTEKKIDDINFGIAYPTKYDKRHDLAIVASYKTDKRWMFAANWVFGTGSAVTMPTGRLVYGNEIGPIYSSRNGARLPAYHRLDFSGTLAGKKTKDKVIKDKETGEKTTVTIDKKIAGEWVFSIYNVYARSNPYSIIFTADENQPNTVKTEKVYLFSIIPAFTYNFKF